MIKNLLFIGFLLVTTPLFSQDLIVTESGDSLNVDIKKIKNGIVQYFILEYGMIQKKRLPESEMAFYQPDFYRAENQPRPQQMPPRPANPIDYQFRFALQGGLGFRTASPPENISTALDEYLRQTRDGWQLAGHLQYFFNPVFGAGFQYNYYRAEHKAEFGLTIEEPDGTKRTGPLSDDITIRYVAPEGVARLIPANHLGAFIFNFGLGWITYENNAKVVDPVTITGSTVALHGGAGYDYRLAPDVFLGFQMSYIAAGLDRVTLDDGASIRRVKLPDNQLEGLNRLDFSLGLRFGF